MTKPATGSSSSRWFTVLFKINQFTYVSTHEYTVWQFFGVTWGNNTQHITVF